MPTLYVWISDSASGPIADRLQRLPSPLNAVTERGATSMRRNDRGLASTARTIAAPIEEAPERANANTDAARPQLFPEPDERDVRRPCDLAKKEGRFGLNAAQLAVAALPLCSDVALLLQPVKPADRARRVIPNRSAAWRHERLRSMASTTRRRRSKEKPWPCTTVSFASIQFESETR
jgi:hypothetical protein